MISVLILSYIFNVDIIIDLLANIYDNIINQIIVHVSQLADIGRCWKLMNDNLILHEFLAFLVSFEVLVDGRHLTEGFIADLTLERFDPVVSVEVFVQSLLPGECLATKLAGVVSGSQVRFDVTIQICLGDKLGLTVNAIKLPNTRVSLCV